LLWTGRYNSLELYYFTFEINYKIPENDILTKIQNIEYLKSANFQVSNSICQLASNNWIVTNGVDVMFRNPFYVSYNLYAGIFTNLNYFILSESENSLKFGTSGFVGVNYEVDIQFRLLCKIKYLVTDMGNFQHNLFKIFFGYQYKI